jgi:hypothetical protein
VEKAFSVARIFVAISGTQKNLLISSPRKYEYSLFDWMFFLNHIEYRGGIQENLPIVVFGEPGCYDDCDAVLLRERYHRFCEERSHAEFCCSRTPTDKRIVDRHSLLCMIFQLLCSGNWVNFVDLFGVAKELVTY